MELHRAMVDAAKWRSQVAMERAGLAFLQERLEETEEWKVLRAAKNSIALAEAVLATSETRARAEILDAYMETGNKKPMTGAGVRVLRKVRYEADAALAWCKLNATMLLTLNAKAFETTALAGIIPDAPVAIEEETTATLASDLSMYLEER